MEPQAPAPSSTTPTVIPSKFSVFQAINDVAGSIKKNPAGTLLPWVLSYVASIVLVMVISFLGLGSVLFSFAMNQVSAANIQTFVILVAIAAVLQAVVQMVFGNAFIIAVKDAFLDQGKQTFGTYLKQGVQVLGRVILSTLLLFAYIVWPIITVILLAFISTLTEALKPIINVLLFLGGIGAIVWTVVAMLRYALYWEVAVFEPDLSIRQVLARSRELMVSRAKWFLVRGYLLSVAAFAAISMIASVAGGGFSASDTSSTTSLLGNLLSAVLIPFMYGVPVILYLKLAGDKKQPEPAQSSTPTSAQSPQTL